MKNKIRNSLWKILQFLKTHTSRKHPDLPFYSLIFFAFVLFVVGINLFVELTDELAEKSLKMYDQKITEYVISFRSPEWNEFFRALTDLGDFYAYLFGTILVAIFLFIKFKHWEFSLQLLAIVVLSSLSNFALKRFIGRPRPEIEHLVVVETMSYPSGHTLCATAFYGFLAYLVFQIKMSKWLRWLLFLFFVVLIFLIGLSRIYLGVHFPSDVAGGFIAGLIWLAFCIALFNIISLYRRKKARKNPSEKEKNLE